MRSPFLTILKDLNLLNRTKSLYIYPTSFLHFLFEWLMQHHLQNCLHLPYPFATMKLHRLASSEFPNTDTFEFLEQFQMFLHLQPKPHPTLYLIPTDDSFEKYGLVTRNHFR